MALQKLKFSSVSLYNSWKYTIFWEIQSDDPLNELIIKIINAMSLNIYTIIKI